jgi:hypothetical protein
MCGIGEPVACMRSGTYPCACASMHAQIISMVAGAAILPRAKGRGGGAHSRQSLEDRTSLGPHILEHYSGKPKCDSCAYDVRLCVRGTRGTLPSSVPRCTRRPRHTRRSHLRLGTRARRTHCHWPHGARLIEDRERNRERADGVGHVDDARHSPLARTAREEQVHLPARRAVSRAARGMHAVCTRYARGMHAVCSRYARGMHAVCSRYARGMHAVCTRYSHVIHAVYCSAARTSARRAVRHAACAWAWPFRYGMDPSCRLVQTAHRAICDARRLHGQQVQIRRRRAQPRCRCGSDKPCPGADVAGVSPVPLQMWQG